MKREDYIISFSYHHCPILVIWTFGCFQTCVGTLFSSEALCIYDELPFTRRSNCFSFYWSRWSRIRWLIVQEGEDTYWACPELKFLLRPNFFPLSPRDSECVERDHCDLLWFSPSSRFTPRLPSSLSRSAKVAEKVNCRKRSQFTDLLIL